MCCRALGARSPQPSARWTSKTDRVNCWWWKPSWNSYVLNRHVMRHVLLDQEFLYDSIQVSLIYRGLRCLFQAPLVNLSKSSFGSLAPNPAVSTPSLGRAHQWDWSPRSSRSELRPPGHLGKPRGRWSPVAPKTYTSSTGSESLVPYSGLPGMHSDPFLLHKAKARHHEA